MVLFYHAPDVKIEVMEDYGRRLQILKEELERAWDRLDLEAAFTKLKKLEQEVDNPDIWRNPDEASKKTIELARLHDELDAWLLLKTQINDFGELLALLDQHDGAMKEELEDQLVALGRELERLKLSLRFAGKYDRGGAILRITAGVGGVDAMDWAGMLERMYLRWAEKEGIKTNILDRSIGEEAGIKTSVIEMLGQNVYGKLKSEHGTHRLVRQSPFNADHLRQTSFAGVEVLPLLQNDNDLKIDAKDLRIDVYHAGGHGGQSVNTTNSAVRITHIPTNTVVAIQNERSQLQNKTKAMEILKGKLQNMLEEQHAESIDKLRSGEAAAWGQQIRNYVLHPYKLVKDVRTKHEEKDVDAVLDGMINGFIEAYLEQLGRP